MNKEVKEIIQEIEDVRDNPAILTDDCGMADNWLVLNAKECKLLLDYINQLEIKLSRETNRRKIATYDYAQLDKKLDKIRAIVSKSLFKTDLVELCRMKNQIIDVLDRVGGSNE